MLTGLTQTGGFAIGVWAPTLLVLVLGASPEYAAFLMIFVNVSAVLGRVFITALIEPLGRPGSATLCLGLGGIFVVVQGHYYKTFIGTLSGFYLALLSSNFFTRTNYSGVRP